VKVERKVLVLVLVALAAICIVAAAMIYHEVTSSGIALTPITTTPTTTPTTPMTPTPTPTSTTATTPWSYTTGGMISLVSISSDGSYIAAGGYNGNVYLFSRASSTPPLVMKPFY
jgi:hypothetical protein